MNRTCVINVAGVSPRVLQRDGGLWINSLAMAPRPLRPTLPAVPASMQATITTGFEPSSHGVVAGGVYRRQSHSLSLEERSNTLLTKKRFWHSSKTGLPRTSLVFWNNPLAGAADIVLGAVSYGAVSLAQQPKNLYEQLQKELGPCDTSLFRGPTASWAASAWAADAAIWIWQNQKPALQWAYLPGVDFEAVRHGVDSPQAFEALRVVDLQAHRLAEAVLASGGQVVVLSDGGYANVHRVSMPNVLLAAAGLLRMISTDLGEVPDLENSAAFAMVDHQAAHVFCADDAAAQEARRALESLDGLAAMLPRGEVCGCGQGFYRCGDWVLLSQSDAWFSYRWWADDAKTPPLASRCDVPGKLGYDPCELFAPAYPSADAASVAGQIDANALRVRASRGLVPADFSDHAFVTASRAIELPEALKATDVPKIVQKVAEKQ